MRYFFSPGDETASRPPLLQLQTSEGRGKKNQTLKNFFASHPPSNGLVPRPAAVVQYKASRVHTYSLTNTVRVVGPFQLDFLRKLELFYFKLYFLLA